MLQEVVRNLEPCRAALSGAPAEDSFAKRTAQNEFSLHLPGPTTEQSREDYIRSRLQSFLTKPMV